MLADFIRSEVFRHSADGQNGTEDTGMTCGNIYKGDFGQQEQRFRELPVLRTSMIPESAENMLL